SNRLSGYVRRLPFAFAMFEFDPEDEVRVHRRASRLQLRQRVLFVSHAPGDVDGADDLVVAPSQEVTTAHRDAGEVRRLLASLVVLLRARSPYARIAGGRVALARAPRSQEPHCENEPSVHDGTSARRLRIRRATRKKLRLSSRSPE